MTHLLIDATFLINELKRKRPPHGLPRVVLAYLAHYQDRIQLLYRLRSKIYILPKQHSQKIIQLVLSWDHRLYKHILWLIVKGIFKTKQGDVHERYFLFKIDQNGMKYSNYFRQIQRLGIKTLVMLHDLFPINYPEYSDPNYAIQFERNIRLSLANATGIICVSQNTLHTVTQYVHDNNLLCPPTIAANLAPGLQSKAVSQARPVTGPYFVMISTIVARKNHLLLLHLWRALAEELGEHTPKLIIIGKRSSECSSTLAMLDRCKTIRQHVMELIATDNELQNCLSHATALLFPTFAEGYGLPLIEALSNNVPVLASDLPIFREIAKDVPEYLDPIDGTGWTKMIKDYAQEHSPQRAAQLQRLAQFTIPTWAEHFQQVDSFVNQLEISVQVN